MKLKIHKLLKILVFIQFFIILIISLQNFANAENQVVFKSNSNDKMKIAITFDDGPHPKNTKRILDVLKKYNVKSTFFVVGVNVKNYPSALNQIVENGHEIGNHTYSHSVLKALSSEKIKKEIIDTEDALNEANVLAPKLLRPPCGLYDNKLLEIAKSKDYKIVLWTIDTKDWEHRPADEIVNKVLGSIKSGDIILFHDYISGVNNTPRALEILIPKLQEMGFNIVSVSELLQS